MSFTPISTNHEPYFQGLEPEGLGAPISPPPVKSPRSRNRAAGWQSELTRAASYLMGQARTEGERAFVEKLYEEALEEGPDFTHYRSKSAFEAAPRLGIDRNAYARILNALDMIERGTYRHCRDKGKQGIPRAAVALSVRVQRVGDLFYQRTRPDTAQPASVQLPPARDTVRLGRASLRSFAPD